MIRNVHLTAAGLAFAVWTAGCGDDPGAPRCVEIAEQPCDDLYPPTWENVYTNTLAAKCATAGGACHGSPTASGAGGGLYFDTLEDSHQRLLDGGWIEPQDAVCSPVVVRLETDDDSLRMPPGSTPLDTRERCSIRNWIAQGAER